MAFRKYCLFVVLVLVAFTAIVHVLSALTRNPLQEAFFVAIFLYLVLAFIAGRRFGFLKGLAVGVLAGAIDSLIALVEGLTINDWLPFPEPFAIGPWLYVSFFVVGTGAVVGLVGGGLGAGLRRNTA